MRVSILASLAALAASASPCVAGFYEFAPINFPAPGPVFAATASQINDGGAVVGSAIAFSGFTQSSLFSGNVFTTLNFPGSADGTTNVVALNNHGDYGGGYTDTFNMSHGFVNIGGTFTTIDFPAPAFGPLITGINDQGLIVGEATDGGTGLPDSFSLSNGQFTSIADPNGVLGTSALDVNDAGSVVGFYTDASGASHGFVLQNGQYMTRDDPDAVPGPGLGTTLFGISTNGMIAGAYNDATGLSHGFVYQNGVFTTVDDPLAVGGTFIDGVNSQGVLVGTGIDATGAFFAFEATPTAAPEPASLTLLACAGVTLATRRLGRRA
jgi:probable HAF family extracellular repeat protein